MLLLPKALCSYTFVLDCPLARSFVLPENHSAALFWLFSSSLLPFLGLLYQLWDYFPDKTCFCTDLFFHNLCLYSCKLFFAPTTAPTTLQAKPAFTPIHTLQHRHIFKKYLLLHLPDFDPTRCYTNLICCMDVFAVYVFEKLKLGIDLGLSHHPRLMQNHQPFQLTRQRA